MSMIDGPPSSIPLPPHPEETTFDLCTMCYLELGPLDGTYSPPCGHRYHWRCALQWAGHDTQPAPRVSIFQHCPNCALEDVRTPLFPTTPAPMFLPWWPTEWDSEPAVGAAAAASATRRSLTQLPGGKISLIVDPGAWTNLLGPELAAELPRNGLGPELAVVPPQ